MFRRLHAIKSSCKFCKLSCAHKLRTRYLVRTSAHKSIQAHKSKFVYMKTAHVHNATCSCMGPHIVRTSYNIVCTSYHLVRTIL